MSAVTDAAVRLLLIHSHPELLNIPAAIGGSRSYAIEFAADVRAAEARLHTEREFAVVVLVVGPPGSQPVRELCEHVVRELECIRRASPASQIVVCLHRGADSELVRAIVGQGVSGVLEQGNRGVDPTVFEARVQDAIALYRQHAAREPGSQHHPIFDRTGFVGQSPAMAELLLSAARAAEISDVPVLVYGETGTGKQLLAETIHRLDPKRRGKRFQTVNCAAIAGSLAESALFGHIKGAFTGATESRLGYFRVADGGTILLDEIGEMEPRLQAKLLRVLQEGVVMPVGSDDEFPVDVRVIAATNRRLDELVERRKFRLDLFNRLNVIQIEIPPIRERPEDIPPLVDYLLAKYQRYARRPIRDIDPLVYDVLKRCTLEGNVRELENVIRQTLAFKTAGERIEVSDLPRSTLIKSRSRPRSSGTVPAEIIRSLCDSIRRGTTTLPQFLNECERVFLSTALDESGDNTRVDLAKQLGLSRRTLYNKRRRHGL